jgi:transposase
MRGPSPSSIKEFVKQFFGNHNPMIMDNLSSHKVDGIRQRIEKRQAELLYLSPDWNPIEKAWSKLKQILRQLKARTADTLDQAITEALSQISPDLVLSEE